MKSNSVKTSSSSKTTPAPARLKSAATSRRGTSKAISPTSKTPGPASVLGSPSPESGQMPPTLEPMPSPLLNAVEPTGGLSNTPSTSDWEGTWRESLAVDGRRADDVSKLELATYGARTLQREGARFADCYRAVVQLFRESGASRQEIRTSLESAQFPASRISEFNRLIFAPLENVRRFLSSGEGFRPALRRVRAAEGQPRKSRTPTVPPKGGLPGPPSYGIAGAHIGVTSHRNQDGAAVMLFRVELPGKGFCQSPVDIITNPTTDCPTRWRVTIQTV